MLHLQAAETSCLAAQPANAEALAAAAAFSRGRVPVSAPGKAGGVVAAVGRLYPGHAGSRDVRCWHNAAHRLKTPDRWGENGCGETNRGTVPATLRKAEGRGAPVRSSGLAAAAQLRPEEHISQLAQRRVWCYSLGSG